MFPPNKAQMLSPNSQSDNIINSNQGYLTNEKNGATVMKINSTSFTIKKNKNTIDLKLFVGQIPKNMTESDVEVFFSDFGEIIDVQILRDKNGIHKGCAFVKFASMTKAEKTIEKIDNKIEMPGSNVPIKIKWADGEPERLGIEPDSIPKLFIGSLPKEATEQNLRDVFEQYGTIEELHLMKEPDGITSKGSGFIRYSLRESALLAIRHLHAQAYILDSDRPIEVRLAENKKKEKPSHPSSFPVNEDWPSQPMMYPPFPPVPPGYPMYGMYFYQYMTKEGVPYYFNPMTMVSQFERPPQGCMIYPGMPGGEVTAPPPGKGSFPNLQQATPVNLNDMSKNGEKKQGPNGANLFVFHIPNTWKDSDLYNLFSPFGTIVSAIVMTDKREGRSRGFGFVSYESQQSAKMAIENLNGFQADSKKRLKVQLKKGNENEANPNFGKFTPF